MNATELHLSDGRTAGVWYCAKCRIVKMTAAEAEQCCKPAPCSRCGNDVKRQFWKICEPCEAIRREEREKAKFDKAEKLTVWEGWVYCEGFGNDGYCESIHELIEEAEGNGDELPKYVYTCDESRLVTADYSDLLTRIQDEAWDGFEVDDLKGLPELKAAVEAFNEANSGVMIYNVNNERVLVLTPTTPNP